MITSNDIMPLIVQAAPDFGAELTRFREDWSPDKPGMYNELNEAVSFLISAYNRNERDCVKDLLDLAERLLTDGDDDVKGITKVGFLETLQNHSSWEPYGSSAFVPLLGPKSKKAWAAIKAQWAGSKGLADIIRKETGLSVKAGDASNGSDDIKDVEDPELRKIIHGARRNVLKPGDKKAKPRAGIAVGAALVILLCLALLFVISQYVIPKLAPLNP